MKRAHTDLSLQQTVRMLPEHTAGLLQEGSPHCKYLIISGLSTALAPALVCPMYAVDWIVPPPLCMLKPEPPSVTVFGDKVSRMQWRLNEVMKVKLGWGPNSKVLWPYGRRKERAPTHAPNPQPSTLSLCHHMKTCKKVAICKSGKEPSLESEPCVNLDLGLVVLQNWEKINSCWPHPGYCIWLWQPEQSMGVCVWVQGVGSCEECWLNLGHPW